MNLQQLANKQEKFYLNDATRQLPYRSTLLWRLYHALAICDQEVLAALRADLGKPEFEPATSEIALVEQEIRNAIPPYGSTHKLRLFFLNFLSLPSKAMALVRQLAMLAIISLLLLPSIARGEQPVYRGRDLFRDLAEKRAGIPVMSRATQIMVQKATSLRVTKKATDVYEFANGIIQDVDLSEMLTTEWAATQPDKWRTLSIHGENHGNHFVVDYKKGPIDGLIPPSLSDFGVAFSIRKDQLKVPQDEDGYGIMLRSKLNLGELSHRTFLRFLSGMLRIMSPENLPKLPAPAARSTLDERGLADARATLPGVMALLDRYSAIQAGMQLKTFGKDPRLYNAFATKVVGKLERLADDYPHLGEFLQTITALVDLTIHLRFMAPNGMKLVAISLDSNTRSITIEGINQGGKFVPVDAAGSPHPEASVDPETITVWDDLLSVDARGSVLGLRFKETGVIIAGHFRDGVIAKFGTKITKIPPPSIEGRALGIFPVWAINLTIPGSIEEYARSFTQGMLVGSQGKGTYGAATIDTTKPGQTMLDSESSTELVDNFFINFGMRIAQKYLWPDKAVMVDAWDLTQAMVAALAKDMNGLQAAENGVAH